MKFDSELQFVSGNAPVAVGARPTVGRDGGASAWRPPSSRRKGSCEGSLHGDDASGLPTSARLASQQTNAFIVAFSGQVKDAAYTLVKRTNLE